MERIAEGTAQSREDLARRLELSALHVADDRITGTVDGFPVALLGGAPFKECHIELGGALPLSLLKLEHGDLNDPDAVETGDPDFDEAMQVIAVPGHAPTLEHVLRSKELRAAVLTFLRRFPDSFVRGNVVVLKSSEGITHEAILTGIELARAMSKQFAHVGFVTTEAPTVIEPTERGPGPQAMTSAIMGGGMLVSWWLYAANADVGARLTGIGTVALLSCTVAVTWLLSRNE